MFGNKSKPANNPTTKASAAEVPMMTEKAASPAAASTAVKNLIAAGTVIEGNIITDGELHLDGTVKGDIRTTGKLIVSNDAFVEGNIFAAQADVAGRITGTVECAGLLVIKASCIITGDIITKSLNVESGSTFDGRCKVGANSRAMPAEKEGKASPGVSRIADMVGKKNGPAMADSASGSALL